MRAEPAEPAGSPARAGDRLLGYVLRRTAGSLGVLVTAAVVRTALALALPALTARAVADLLAAGAATRAVTVVAALTLVAVAAETTVVVSGGMVAARVGAVLRHRLVDAVLASGVAGRRRFAAGDLTARLTGHVDQVAAAVPMLVNVGLALITGIGAVVAVARYSGWLALAVVAVGPPVLLLMRAFLDRSVELFRRYQRLQAGIAARLTDALGGVRTIRAAGTAEQEIDRVVAELPELHRTGVATWLAQRHTVWRVSLVVPLAEVVLLAAAGVAVDAGRLPAPGLLAVAGYLALAFAALTQVDAVLGVAQTRAAAVRLAEVVDAAPVASAIDRVELPAGPGEVELRGVSVYDRDRPVLRDVDLRIPAGAVLALVGPGGAGKSLLTALLGRLVDPDAGQVFLDGVPVTKVDPRVLRTEVGYAFDRPALLGRTIRDMIGYGAGRELGEAELVAAARAAAADHVVPRLPDGYDTPLRQAPLSGGELQRLGLARAVARRPRVLVLDDATSSLDTLTEEQVNRALAERLAGRTRVVVARRARTAARADLVAWLDGGVLRGTGRHAELWADPDYRAVFDGDGGGR